MPVFAGARIQRGHGLGSILGGFFRRLVLPFVKSNAKNVLTNAVKTDMEVADDVLEGRSLKESAKRRVPAGIKRTVRGLNFQSGSPTQTRMEHGRWIEYHPLTTVADGSPIEFDVGASEEDYIYINFANTMLYVKTKITRADCTNLANDYPIGPSNLFLHSLFSQVDVSLNGTLITTFTNTYPYRAMMETLLSYGEDAKRTQLTSALFYKNRSGRMAVWNLRTTRRTTDC